MGLYICMPAPVVCREKKLGESFESNVRMKPRRFSSQATPYFAIFGRCLEGGIKGAGGLEITKLLEGYRYEKCSPRACL